MVPSALRGLSNAVDADPPPAEPGAPEEAFGTFPPDGEALDAALSLHELSANAQENMARRPTARGRCVTLRIVFAPR